MYPFIRETLAAASGVDALVRWLCGVLQGEEPGGKGLQRRTVAAAAAAAEGTYVAHSGALVPQQSGSEGIDAAVRAPSRFSVKEKRPGACACGRRSRCARRV